MTPPGPGLNPTPPTLGDRTRTTSTPADVRRRAHARLSEKIDPARCRHKPLSILRAEARRLVEAQLDADAPSLSEVERGRLTEDVLAETVGVGPLEELFRDETVQEILVANPHQVLARRFGRWVPTTARFRDAEQLRAVLARFGAVGELLTGGPDPTAAVDVRLTNGFRVVAVLPPESAGLPPVALFARGPSPGSGAWTGSPSGLTAVPAARSGVVPVVRSAAVRNPLSRPSPPTEVTASQPTPLLDVIMPAPDSFAQTRQRITERMVAAMAARRVYDLDRIALPDLRRIVLAHVIEYCEAEKLAFDDGLKERLALEILAGMNR